MRHSLFSSWFINNEPEIYKTIENINKRLPPFFIGTVVLCVVASLFYFILPIGLAISFAILAIVFLLIVTNVLLSPSILVACNMFFKSKIKFKVGVLIFNGLLLLGISLYIAYTLIPFFLSGLELYAESTST